MAAVRLVLDLKVKPGRQNELLEGLKNLKKVAEKLGASVHVFRARVGDPTHIIGVAEWADLVAWAKGSADPELAGLADGMRNNPNPPWETISIQMVEEIPL